MSKFIRRLKKKYPRSKQVLAFAALGVFVAGSLVMPDLARIFQGRRINFEDFLLEDSWEEFDEARVRQKLKELRKRKLIKIYLVKDQFIVKITEKGRKRLLQYNLEQMTIPTPNEWDKRWRLVTYDVPKGKNRARDAIRTTLKRLGFYQLQKSVYLYPFPCSEAIEFLRELYDIGENVTMLTVGYLENEEVYKEYFDL